MNRLSVAFFLALNILSCDAQTNSEKHRTISSAFDQKIESAINFTVPIMTVEDLQPKLGSFVLLDAREREEYEVSHIEKAQYVGYQNADLQALEITKETPIVIYCSIGYRSEKIGEKLKKEGYTEVYNLYGSIFEWVNQGNPVVDMNGQMTNRIHTYNKKWSNWVAKEEMEKVW